MKVSLLLSSSVLALAMLTVAHAQTTPASGLTVLPPPSIDDPGARPVPQPTPGKSSAPAPAGTAIPVPALPSMHQDAPQDAQGEAPPTMKVEKHDGKLIEQYYQGGQLYMVRVHPRHGVPYTYFVDKQHKLTRSAGAPPVNPVLYTILEWGGSSSSSDDSQ